MGVELKRNLKEYWWRKTVQERDDVVGMDGSILTHNSCWWPPATWAASPTRCATAC